MLRGFFYLTLQAKKSCLNWPCQLLVEALCKENGDEGEDAQVTQPATFFSPIFSPAGLGHSQLI